MTSKSTKKRTKKKKSVPKRKARKKPASRAAAKKKPARKRGAWDAALAPRQPDERRYWLVKSEPDVFSFDDLLRRHNKTTPWDGVRNFTARNFMRDGMKVGDRVFYYHSMSDAPGIVGICEVVRDGYPDPSALDPTSDKFDPKATKVDPIWYMVDIRAVAQFTHPVPLARIKERKELRHMALLRIGRLSVTPVSAAEWETICGMAS